VLGSVSVSFAVEVLYFMLLHAVAMTVSYRHILEYFGEQLEELERLKAAMTRCVLATFFPEVH
jgi:hypothetical protein